MCASAPTHPSHTYKCLVIARTLQPSEPSAPEEWQQALNAICSALPEGRTQLESLVRRTGAQASCLHIMVRAWLEATCSTST